MKALPILLIFLAALFVVPGLTLADDEKKGHGAGGVRADHASDTGLDQGKAWAGTKEKKEKKEKKVKKENRQKKAKD